MKRIALFLFFVFSVITCLAQTQIDSTYQIRWNLLSGSGSPTITCTQNGDYTVYPYGAEWGQPYQDTTNNVEYKCTTSGWVKNLPATGGTLTGAIAFSNNSAANSTMTNLGMTQTGSVGTSSQVDTLSGSVNVAGSVVASTVAATTPISIASGGTGNSSGAATSVPYSGLTGTVPTWNQNTTGNAATATSLVYLVNVSNLSGATADVKLNACHTAIVAAGGGVCDARGLIGNQTIASTVTIGGSGVSETFIFEPATSFIPSSTSVQMFQLQSGTHLQGVLNINTTSVSAYAATVVLINGEIANQNDFSSDGILIQGNATTAPSTSIGVDLVATNEGSQSITEGIFSHIKVVGLYTGLQLFSSGTGFINGNNFIDVRCIFNNIGMVIATGGSNVAAQVAGNNFSHYVYQAGPAPTLGIEIAATGGTSGIQSNTFSPVAIWDVAGTGGWDIINYNATNTNNLFIGYIPGPVSDVDTGGSGGSNAYFNGADLKVNSIELANFSASTITLGGSFLNNSTSTTTGCSISGNIVSSESMQGTAEKRVIVSLNACNGTQTYTFPVAFYAQPGIFPGSTLTSANVTSLNLSSVTVNGTGTTGVMVLDGR